MFWYLSHGRLTKAQTSLHKYADLLGPSYLYVHNMDAYEDIDVRPKFRPLALLEMSAWVFKIKEAFQHMP